MDVNQERLAFAREHFNVEATIQAGEDAAMQIAELTDGEMPTLVFDATGNQRSVNASFNLFANGGRLVLVGLFQGDVTFRDSDAHRRELTLLRSRNATATDFRRVMSLLEDGRIDIQPWITHRVGFADVVEQFPRWLDPQSRFIKAVIEM